MLAKRNFQRNSNNCIKKQIKCKQCQKRFFSERYFLMHFQSHSVEKKFLCDVCGKIFSNDYFFKIHVRKHTKEKLDTRKCEIFKLHLDFSVEEENEDYSEGEQSQKTNTDDHKKFSCKLCKKNFFLENYLIFHLRSHAKEKCLLCHLCGRRYSNHHYFKMHLFTHRKVKPMMKSHTQDIPSKANSPLIALHNQRNQIKSKPNINTSSCLYQLLVKQEITQPFDHVQSWNAVEPCQGAAIVSNCDRTEIGRAMSLDSNMPNSEYSYIPEQGLSVSNVFEQASSHSSISAASDDFSAGVGSFHSSDFTQHAVNGLPQLNASGETYSEECVLGLDAPSFGQISYSHLSVVTDATGKKIYCCIVCKRTFAFACHLNEHLRNHWHKNLLTCKICQKEFDEQEELSRHFCDRAEIKPLICEVCHTVFSRERALSQHLLTHTAYKSFICHVCGKSFKLKPHLCMHITRAHKKKKYFYCDLCEKQYLSVDALQAHYCEPIKKMPYICDVCNAHFPEKTILLQHPCPYAVKDACLCDICQRRCSAFKLHSPPLNQDMYACNLCDGTFSQKSELREHLRNHAQSQVYSCSKCKKRFTHKCGFDYHVRNCHLPKLLSCVICEKKFADGTTFQKHVDSHLDKEFYECHFCDKIFTRKHHLIRHEKTHNE